MIYKFLAQNTSCGLDFDLEFDKNKKVYCFIGENGSGKTQFLLNLVNSLLSQIKENHTLNTNEKSINNRIRAEISDFLFDKSNLPVVNSRDLAQDKYPELTKPLIYINSLNRQTLVNQKINSVNMLEKKETYFFQAIHKLINNYKSISIFKVKTENENGKETELDARLIFSDWIARRAFINTNIIPKDDLRRNELDILILLLNELEPEWKGIYSEGYDTINFYQNPQTKQVMINNYPIDNLPSGYASIIKIFIDIISGLGAWFGVTDIKDIREGEAIVCIDEIDIHLHGKWQYKIIPLFKKIFPKVTFYITTHSPIIVSSTEDGEAYELVRNENLVSAKKLGNPKSWYFDDILQSAFGIEPETKEFVKINEQMSLLSGKIDDYFNDKSTKNKADVKQLYDTIKNELNTTDPRAKTLDSMLELIDD